MKWKKLLNQSLALGLAATLAVSLNAPVFAWADDEASAPEQAATSEVSEFSSGASAVVWDGSEIADSFAAGDGTQASPYEISSAAQLAYLAKAVNEGNAFAQEHFILTVSIDLNGQTWTPIGTRAKPFSGTLDGNGETISNLMISDPTLTGAGLFGVVTSGAVKNLTLSNASVTAAAEVGALAGSAYTGSVENCMVVGAIKIQGNYKVGGLAGDGYAKVVGSSVEGAAGSYVKGVWTAESNLEGDNVGGLLGFTGEGAPNDRIQSCRVSGLEVSGTRKVGGLLGYLHHSASVRDSVVDSVTVKCDLTGNPNYLDGINDSSGIGGLVGVVHGKDGEGANAGSMTDSTVSNVRLVTEGTRSMAGYFYGKLRKTTEAPTVSNCIAINCTGSTVASDATAYKGSDGESAAAQIGQGGDARVYSTLQGAVDAAQPGDTVKLLKSLVDQGNIAVQGGKILTLDLNGFNIGFLPNKRGTNNCFTLRGATLTVAGAGKIYEQGYYLAPIDVFGSSEDVANYSVLNVGKDVVLEGYDGVIVSATDNRANGVVINVDGTLSGKADKDGYGGVGLAVSGNVQGAEGSVPKITLGSSARVFGEMGSSSDVQVAVSNGMYLAGYADTVVKEGAIVEAGTGIEVRAGKLTVEGGTVTGTAAPMSVEPNGNGSTSSGVGIAVVQHTTTLPIDVNVSGGSISGFSALYAGNAQDNSADDLAKVSIAVTGGAFQAINGGTRSVYSQNKTSFITGGTFSTDPTAYVADDCYVDLSNGVYTVKKSAPASIVFDSNGGSPVAAIEGMTGKPVQGSLPANDPVREGYRFAGWFASPSLSGNPVTQLPAIFPEGITTYYAKWNAVFPVPGTNVEIQVEQPPQREGAPASAAVPDEAVKAAARSAQSALDEIEAGQVPAGMSEQEAREIGDLVAGAQEGETVSVVVSLGFAHKPHEVVEEGERGAIEGVAADGEEVALFLELSVKMTVKVAGADGSVKDERTVELGEVDEPLLFEVHVDPALIQGKSARIAHVHNGATEIIYPESVDRDRGIIMLRADKFSTYALLTSETCAVSFESNGGTAVESQTVKFGEKVAKPTDPTREGFSFAGWYADVALSRAYDFSQPVEGFMTLYAKWTALSGGAEEGDGAKPLPGAEAGKTLASTGDGAASVALCAIGIAVAAGVVLATSRRRRSR